MAATLAALASAPLLVWSVVLAARSLEPYVDSPHTVYAAVADLLLAAATALLATAAARMRGTEPFCRLMGRYEPLYGAGGALLLAMPLATAVTNDLDSSSIGAGEPSLGLSCVGAAGLGIALSVLMTRRVRSGLLAAGTLALVLIAVALARDILS